MTTENYSWHEISEIPPRAVASAKRDNFIFSTCNDEVYAYDMEEQKCFRIIPLKAVAKGN